MCPASGKIVSAAAAALGIRRANRGGVSRSRVPDHHRRSGRRERVQRDVALVRGRGSGGSRRPSSGGSAAPPRRSAAAPRASGCGPSSSPRSPGPSSAGCRQRAARGPARADRTRPACRRRNAAPGAADRPSVAARQPAAGRRDQRDAGHPRATAPGCRWASAITVMPPIECPASTSGPDGRDRGDQRGQVVGELVDRHRRLGRPPRSGRGRGGRSGHPRTRAGATAGQRVGRPAPSTARRASSRAPARP